MPSKLLVAAAEAAHQASHAPAFGVQVPVLRVDGAAVMARLRGAWAAGEFPGQRDVGLPAQRILGRCGCVHRGARPRCTEAAAALLRNCATAPAHPLPWIAFAKKGAALVYRCAKQRSAPTSDKPGAKVDELHLTLLELIDRIAALMPPPRTHRRKRCHCPSSLRKPSWVRVRQSRACRRSAHLPTTCGQC